MAIVTIIIMVTNIIMIIIRMLLRASLGLLSLGYQTGTRRLLRGGSPASSFVGFSLGFSMFSIGFSKWQKEFSIGFCSTGFILGSRRGVHSKP